MILWLASYPKSGNTLLRSILTSLIYTEDGNVDFGKLLYITNFPAAHFYEKFNTKYDNINDVYKYSLQIQKKINEEKKLKIFKTHSSRCIVNEHPFTDDQNTIGAIYIVRDPRDVLVSSSVYFNISFEETKNTMFKKESIITNVEENKPISSLVGSWSDHYNSWVKYNKNTLLIKYENLILNKELEIFRIINFINGFKKFHIPEQKIKNVINSSSFYNMSNMEKKGLFKENSKDKNGNPIRFFNNGKIGTWKENVDEKITKNIEKIFYNEMLELGYIE